MNAATIRTIGLGVAIVALTLIASSRVSASTSNYWINSAGGSSTDTNNWSTGTTPSSGQLDYFTNNASYQVTWPTYWTYSDGIYFNATSGVVTNNIGAGGLLYMVNAPATFSVGDSAGSDASVVQTGPGGLWVYNLYVGNNGRGSFIASGPTSVSAPIWLGVGITNGSAGSTFVATNGASVNANGSGTIIGWYAGADSNTVIATGAGTTFLDNYSLRVGSLGSGNTLRIEDGAKMVGVIYYTDIGYGASSSNNTMIVTGPNSLWANTNAYYSGSYLAVGDLAGGGGNNHLIVSNGATMLFVGGNSYVGTSDNGNDLLHVSGSTFSNAANNFYVGYQSPNNNVLIDNGGKVLSLGASGATYIGYSTAGSSNNTVTVTGTNSFWGIGGDDFRIGNASSGNSLIISNGATAQYNGANARVGAFSTAPGSNSLIVTGPGSTMIMTNAATDLSVGYSTASPNNYVLVNNGGQLLVGGRLILGWNVAGNSNNTVTVTGPNSFLGIGGGAGDHSMYVGIVGANNSFTISNGASAQFDGTNKVYVGYSSAGNTFTVTDPGSVFSNTAAEFNLGRISGNNRLLIDNGGQFFGSNLVLYTGAAGNTLTITNGGGAAVNNLNAAGSQLSLVGGSLQTRSSAISGNTVVGGGANTMTWTMTGGTNVLGPLFTGNNGAVIVTNGAYLQTAQFDGGYNGSFAATANNSLVVVSGSGTVWSNASGNQFIVGYNGAGNTLRIENGASVFAPGTGTGLDYIGDQGAQSSNNTMLVTGTNSLWQGKGDFRVGNYGAGNSLVVSNGAKVQNDGIYMFLGTFTSASNSSITVTGPGSTLVLTNSGYSTGRSTIGYQAPNNRLTIENGGQMFSVAGSGTARFSVGESGPTGSNNTILVTGSNSFWGINAGSGATPEFSLGFASGGNTLTISNGAGVRFDGNYFEIGVNTANNSVRVTGAGSTFSNAAANFYAGYGGSNNRLTIDSGGTFVSSNLLVGFGTVVANAANVTVTGTNSFLNVLDTLTVSTTVGSLTITNAGAVVANQLVLNGALNLVGGTLQTHGSTASGTTMVGGGPDIGTWTMLGGSNTVGGYLVALRNGSLIVTNGAYLKTTGFRVGGNGGTGDTNGLAVISGPGTVLTNTAGDLTIGYSDGGVGNTLRVENGARLDSFATGTTYYWGGLRPGSTNNTVMVTGSNSVLNVGGVGSQIRMSEGVSGNSQNSVIVSNGGSLWFGGVVMYLGIAGGSDSVTISGPHSTMTLSNASLYSWNGVNDRISIDNGGTLVASNLLANVSQNFGVTVSGTNSLLRVLNAMTMGNYNGWSLSVSNAGAAQADKITLYSVGGTITANGGSVLATNATTTGFLDVKYGKLTLTNGGVVRVDSLYATNGANSVLNLASGSLWTHDATVSNSAVTVIGDGVAPAAWTMLGGTNSYANGLRISANATLGGGGLVRGAVTNFGTILVQNNNMTFQDAVTIGGRYISDPSTNTFLTNVTVTASGTLEGGPGDLFDFKRNLTVNSTNNSLFNLASSTVSFSGGGNHTNVITGGDFGTNALHTAGNFGYAKLSLGSVTDQLYFVSGGFTNGNSSANALYVRELDLFNDPNLVTNLHSAFNIYYLSFQHDTFNTYLNDQTYNLAGGGFLMPVVPEPSALLLLLTGISLAWRKWFRSQ